MKKEEVLKTRQNVQRRLVVWIVLTICFQIINVITDWDIVQIIAWFAAAYCVVLIILFCYLEWRRLHL